MKNNGYKLNKIANFAKKIPRRGLFEPSTDSLGDPEEEAAGGGNVL